MKRISEIAYGMKHGGELYYSTISPDRDAAELNAMGVMVRGHKKIVKLRVTEIPTRQRGSTTRKGKR